MEYVTREQMRALVPEEYIAQAMDDDGEGTHVSAVWTEVSESVSDAIEGPLGQRYAVPFATPFPFVVRHAARVLCAELLYLRRGFTGEKNPWRGQAGEVRAHLAQIGAGKAPLSPEHDKATPSGTVIDEPARTHSASGRLMI